MSSVRLDGITKRYGHTLAVEDISLNIAEREFVTLLGPSGCGKTTLLRIIAGLIEPTAGRIYFDQQDVTYLSPRARNIGFVFQQPALFPHLSVADNVGFGLSVKGVRKDVIAKRVEDMLALVGLSGYGKRMPAQLSGGQQQRVALARVLATDPRVLLFDEPLSALDRNLRETLKYSILDLQRKTGKTAIYVTHDQTEAFAISDRIVVMNAGRIEQIGTQMDIYLHPATPFVAEFIGANNSLSGVVTSVQEGEVTVDADGLRIHCRPHSAFREGDAVLGYIRPENIALLNDKDDHDVHHIGYINVFDGVLDRVIFEGATAQVRVNVNGRELRVDVSGAQRLTLSRRGGRVRIGFNDVTLIPKPA
ncbi:MAG: ABC transporter ATP-binding protein [Anaerolineae bacterium]|nr:ABC transporter ATP-binding protein [Candidatus Roseilinea sp.]MDW8451622.1 ABC transporter ATP-binding protein [Anaerolineae bacterium]